MSGLEQIFGFYDNFVRGVSYSVPQLLVEISISRRDKYKKLAKQTAYNFGARRGLVQGWRSIFVNPTSHIIGTMHGSIVMGPRFFDRKPPKSVRQLEACSDPQWYQTLQVAI